MIAALLLFISSLAGWEDSSAVVSAYAVDGQTGEVLLDDHSGKSLVPASCMKVVTTAAALHLLGPETRFCTTLEYDGNLDEQGVLHGNLYIRGEGDPCLGSERFAPWHQQLDLWADAIEKLGVRRIEGAVIGDATAWEAQGAIGSWALEDTGNYYGASPSALSFHENSYSLTFQPGETVGSKTQILRLDPPIEGLTLHNEVLTGPVGSGDQACIFDSGFSHQCVRGTLPLGVPEFTIKGAIPNPAATCAHLLSCHLAFRGISSATTSLAPQPRTPFHTTLSPPVKEIVYWTNQKSVNLYAEHLLRKMGNGSTSEGIRAVTAFLTASGIDLKGFHMVDGSGLSRQNCITAKQLVSILLLMKDSPLFLASLPQQSDGSVAKPGSMSRIRGLAGFKDNAVFAILINQTFDPDTRAKIHAALSSLRPSQEIVNEKF